MDKFQRYEAWLRENGANFDMVSQTCIEVPPSSGAQTFLGVCSYHTWHGRRVVLMTYPSNAKMALSHWAFSVFLTYCAYNW